MLRYRLAAAALKAFSMNATTRRAYRRIGNIAGARRRSRAMRTGVIDRAHENLAFAERHGAIADGMRVMELGTGWVHWEALFTRAFYDVETILFDVWDNRQFEGFRRYARGLHDALPDLTERDAEAREKAGVVLRRVLECRTFEEVYSLLGWTYFVEPEGRLDAIADASIDLVFSSDVMEHIPARSLPRLAGDLARVLRDGGHANQQIVMGDHLRLYAPHSHWKAYLSYTDKQWTRWFENEVQYQNRWQHSDYVRLFREHGFIVVDDEISGSWDTTGLPIAARWQGYDKADLDAVVSRLIVRKGAAA